ncbi:transcription initiation protein SPT3 homolog [Clavelina lepadiformis]|uniref:transcription initiation protein SPT3 homolog n=1 Tax=Clavelina lepadiformis TaxID=159417 RepID=UPI0040414229
MSAAKKIKLDVEQEKMPMELADSCETSSSPIFQKEIQCMLHGFGDVAEPLEETAVMVHKIVHAKMCDIIMMVSATAQKRGSKSIGIEDVIYLLTPDKSKLNRYLNHLKFKDMKGKFTDEPGNEDLVLNDIQETFDKSYKRIRICRKFLQCIKPKANLNEMFNSGANDPVRLKRLARAEFQTRDMNTNEYLLFSECRSVTFAKKPMKFYNWFEEVLLQVEVQPSHFGWESLEFLAHDLVAEIVDAALLVKNDQERNCKPYEPDITLLQTATHGMPKKQKTSLTCSHIREAFRRLNYFRPITF